MAAKKAKRRPLAALRRAVEMASEMSYCTTYMVPLDPEEAEETPTPMMVRNPDVVRDLNAARAYLGMEPEDD